VDSWRNWRDALLRGATDDDRLQLRRDVERTQLAYSRGGSLGFLHGDNHQTLVVATTPKHRGLEIGIVREVRARTVLVTVGGESTLRELLRPGMGVKFELLGRSAEEHDPENAPGGPLFGVRFLKSDLVELSFGQPGPDLSRVRAGDEVRLTGDPEIAREAERRVSQPALGRIPLTLRVSGRAGERLQVEGQAQRGEQSFRARAETQVELQPSRSGAGLDRKLAEDKLGAFGGTPFHLESLDLTGLAAGLHIPVSELKQVRRELVAQLDLELARNPYSPPLERLCVPELQRELSAGNTESLGAPELIPLCRTEEQLEAVIASGFGAGAEVELDWMEMVGLTRAVQKARSAGLRVTLATVRVQKPGEEAYDRRVAGLRPEGVLARHWGALMHFARAKNEAMQDAQGLAIHGDFSLNVTNSLTAHHLLGLGLETVTASHDLNKAQLLDLLRNVPQGRVALTLHHHIPTFHNSHCVYAHLLSKGADYRTCGRPCEEHRIALRDYAGHEHPVVVDVSCRNTVFNALAQSAAPLVPQLLELGVRRFRVELVWEKSDEVVRTLSAYRKLLAGEISPAAALEAARVHERYGVTTPLRIRKR
jgi:putative protease